MFSLYSRVAAAQLRRDRAAVAVLVDDAPRRLQRLGLRRPQPPLVALAAQAGRRRLQRLVHVPDPAGGPRRDRTVAAALHQVGRLRVRPARQGGRLPDGDLPGCGRVARAVDRQERRARLAGLLPPPQPLRRGAAALALPQGRPADPGEPQPPDQAPGVVAVLHRRDPPPGAPGRAGRARTSCTTTCRRSSREINAFRKQFTDAQLETDRDAFPPVRRKKPPRKGRDAVEIPGRLSQLLTAGPGADPPAAAGPRAVAGVPRGRAHRDGRQVVPAGRLRLGHRLDERRHLRRVLQARPREVPRAAAQDHRDPRAVPARVAAAGRRSTARRCPT